MLTPVQRIIYSLTAIGICYILCYAIAEQISSDTTLSKTWFVWIIFILSQTYLQNKIWSVNKPNKDGVYIFREGNYLKQLQEDFVDNLKRFFSRLSKIFTLIDDYISFSKERGYILLVVIVIIVAFIAMYKTSLEYAFDSNTYSHPTEDKTSTTYVTMNNSSNTFIAPENEKIIDKSDEENEDLEFIGNQANNYDSPFASCFGSGLRNGHETLSVINGTNSDAIICLYDPYNEKTIRNEYVRKNNTIYLDAIPEGVYSIRVIYGNNWNPNKISPCGSSGFFTSDINYSETEKTSHFGSFTYTLQASVNGNSKSKKIDKEEMFKQ